MNFEARKKKSSVFETNLNSIDYDKIVTSDLFLFCFAANTDLENRTEHMGK